MKTSTPGHVYNPKYPPMAYLRAAAGVLLTFLVFLIALMILIPGLLLSLGRLKPFFIKHLGAFIGIIVLRTLGIKLTYDYSRYKPDIPAVYIVNHSSTLDMFAIIALKLPNARYVAKKEIQYNPLFFIIGRITGQIFIDRKRTTKTINQLKKIYDRVKKNRISLLVAPEGTRKHKKLVAPFKKGAFHIARDTGYPIVPIYIDGAYPLCPGSGLVTLPGEVILRYYPPISIDDRNDEQMNDEIENLRDFYKERYRETFKRLNLDIPV